MTQLFESIILADTVQIKRNGDVLSHELIDKAKRYDDMRDSLIGLRNSAWAVLHTEDNYPSTHVLYYTMLALLENDIEVLALMRYPVV